MVANAPEETPLEIIRKVFAAASQGSLDHPSLMMVTKLLGDAGNYPLSAELLRTWVAHTKSPLLSIVYCDLGDVLLKVNDKAGAEQAYKQSLQINPGNHRAQVALAVL